ncbi:Serine/threonine-protein phosphatase 7 long form [Glycine soja]
MASSSSCSSNISINSSPVDGDVLWMQDKHIWNDEEDRKLHIRRVIPTYQGQEEIPEEIIPLLRRFTRAWILQFIRGVLFVDKSSNKVLVRYLQFLRDFRECSTYSWGSAVLGYLYREMYNATNYKTKSIGGMCILIHVNFNKIFIYH